MKGDHYKWRPMKGRVVAGICPIHDVFYRGSVCPLCIDKMSRVSDGPAVHTFKPMVYRDICETPLLIESKAQLKRECKKHDVTACRLM